MAGRTPSSERVAPDQVQSLGALIRQRRDELGWSRDRLGRMTGLSVSTIRAVEGATVNEPGFFTVAALAGALGLSPEALHAVVGRKAA